MKPIIPIAAAALLAAQPLNAENLLENGDFEDGAKNWSAFVPPDAQPFECSFAPTDTTPHEGSSAGELSSKGDARFAAVNYVKGYEFQPGERFRVSAWVKAGDNFVRQEGTAGYCLRVSMFADAGSTQNADDGMFYLGTNNVAVRGSDVSLMKDQEIPTKWTKLEGVFEVAPNTAKLNVCIFVWKGTGSFLIDDVTLEKVDNSVELTPTDK